MLGRLIFAQQEFPLDFGPQPEVAAQGLLAAIVIGILIALVIQLAVLVVVSFLMYSCFERIPAQHRQMESWQAWLLVIPLFNLVWSFFAFPKLARSYQSYFSEQGRTDVGDCGEKIGLWFAICLPVGVFAGVIPCIGTIAAMIAGPAALVLLVIFLVKALTLKGLIPEQTM